VLFDGIEGSGDCGVVGIGYLVVAFRSPYLSGHQCFDAMLEDCFILCGDGPEVDGVLVRKTDEGGPEAVFVVVAADEVGR